MLLSLIFFYTLILLHQYKLTKKDVNCKELWTLLLGCMSISFISNGLGFLTFQPVLVIIHGKPLLAINWFPRNLESVHQGLMLDWKFVTKYSQSWIILRFSKLTQLWQGLLVLILFVSSLYPTQLTHMNRSTFTWHFDFNSPLKIFEFGKRGELCMLIT